MEIAKSIERGRGRTRWMEVLKVKGNNLNHEDFLKRLIANMIGLDSAKKYKVFNYIVNREIIDTYSRDGNFNSVDAEISKETGVSERTVWEVIKIMEKHRIFKKTTPMFGQLIFDFNNTFLNMGIQKDLNGKVGILIEFEE